MSISVIKSTRGKYRVVAATREGFILDVRPAVDAGHAHALAESPGWVSPRGHLGPKKFAEAVEAGWIPKKYQKAWYK